MFSTLSTKSIQKTLIKRLQTNLIQWDHKQPTNILKEIENIKKDKTAALAEKYGVKPNKKNTDCSFRIMVSNSLN